MLSYKVFIDKEKGMLLEAGETFGSITELTKQLTEKYSPYKVRHEVFKMIPNCYAFFVNPNI